MEGLRQTNGGGSLSFLIASVPVLFLHRTVSKTISSTFLHTRRQEFRKDGVVRHTQLVQTAIRVGYGNLLYLEQYDFNSNQLTPNTSSFQL